ncbi:MAG: hypothetical protein ACE5OY_05925 [Candidatus Bathyarchaeia archaeon]
MRRSLTKGTKPRQQRTRNSSPGLHRPQSTETECGRYDGFTLVSDKGDGLGEELKSTQLSSSGEDFLITVHTKRLKTLEEAINRVRKNPKLMASTDRSFRLNIVLDGIVDDYFSVMEELEIENLVLEWPSGSSISPAAITVFPNRNGWMKRPQYAIRMPPTMPMAAPRSAAASPLGVFTATIMTF